MKFKTNLYWRGIEVKYKRTACRCLESICRCTEIYDTRIESMDVERILEELFAANYGNRSCSYLDFYCFDRICREYKIYDEDCYDIIVRNGYYGQEIDGVFFVNEDKVNAAFDKVLKYENDIDKIKYILELEYGYLIDDVEKATKVSIIDCDTKDVIAPNREYYRKMDEDVVESYKDFRGPCAICKKHKNLYMLIDGYHRFRANKNSKQIKIILLE